MRYADTGSLGVPTAPGPQERENQMLAPAVVAPTRQGRPRRLLLLLTLAFLSLPSAARPDPTASTTLPLPVNSEETLMPLSSLIPEAHGNWIRDGEDEIYDARTIFKYMNGAGEVYLSFAFQQLCVRRYLGNEQGGITVELYDMGNAADAFGIFSRNLTGKEVDIGQGSEYRSGYLNFWKDRFFATVYADRESSRSREAVLGIGRDIASQIPVSGARPELLEVLPVDGLLMRSVRYFHRHTDLNQHYFLADTNILNLDHRSEAVLANYREKTSGEYPALLLVVRYPSRREAAAAFGNYLHHFLPEAQGEGAYQLEDGTWTAAGHAGRYILAVYDAASAPRAQELLVATRARLNE